MFNARFAGVGIAAALLLCMPVAAVADDPPKKVLQDSIKTFSDALKAQTDKDKSLATDPDIQNALLAIRAQIFGVDCNLDPHQQACQIARLTKFLADWQKTFDADAFAALSAQERATLVGQLATSIDALVRLERTVPATALTNALTRTNAALDAAAAVDDAALTAITAAIASTTAEWAKVLTDEKLKALAPTQRDALVKAVTPLLDQLSAIEQRAPLVGLTNALARTNAALDAAGSVDDAALTKLKTALTALHAKLKALECGKASAVDCTTAAIKPTVTEWTALFTADTLKTLSPAQSDALVKAVTFTLDQLTPLERLDAAAAYLNGVTRLSATIGAVDVSGKTAADKIKAKQNDIKALVALLSGAIGKPRVNIVGAWFGDFDEIAIALDRVPPQELYAGRRFCSATRAVQSLCQARTRCYETPLAGSSPTQAEKEYIIKGLGAHTNGGDLCGYDPAPYADRATKGLIVAYQCLTEDDDYWQNPPPPPATVIWPRDARTAGLDAKSPRYGPARYAQADAVDGKVYGAILRASVLGDIRCYIDLPP